MPKKDKKPVPKFILPVLLALGALFGLVGFIFNIPSYIELASTKVTYPDSYEFKIYDRLLKAHVKRGLVDYQALRNDPDLKAAYDELKHTSPSHLKGKLELLSFWINTYNLLTIKCIADSYPIARLRQESALKTFIVGGKLYSLNQIKDEIFPDLISTSDWRAIFLICNGSISAPFIARHAYTASRIGDEFEPALKRFVLSDVNYGFDEKQRMFSISPFYRNNLRYIDAVYPSPFDLVNDFLPRDKQVDLESSFRNYAMPYDWRINDTAWLKDVEKVAAERKIQAEQNEKEIAAKVERELAKDASAKEEQGDKPEGDAQESATGNSKESTTGDSKESTTGDSKESTTGDSKESTKQDPQETSKKNLRGAIEENPKARQNAK